MTIHIISSDTTSQINAQISGDTWVIKTGVYVTTTGSAIWSRGSTSEKTFYIDGTVITETFNGISLGTNDGSGGDNKVTVGDTGSIYAGGEGISSDGGQLAVTNYGLITGGNGVSDNVSSTTGEGIQALGGRNTVINEGTIASVSQSASGILLGGTGNYIENSGIIRTRSESSFDAAVDFGSGTSGYITNTLVNTGLISGFIAINGNNGWTETITNAGEIMGLVSLRGGDDTLTNHGLIDGAGVDVGNGADTVVNRGEIVGTIYLGSGDDLMVAGASAEVVDGGFGTDTIDYSSVMATVGNGLRLDGGQTWGIAAGDRVTQVENLIGTGMRDVLVGNFSDNVLEGGAGNDTYWGGQGTDTASFAGSSSGVAVDLEANTGSGGHAAGDDFNQIENLRGSAFGDTLIGDAGVNRLEGGDGDDVLNGGAGIDVFDGGSDSDTVSYAGSSLGAGARLDGETSWNAAQGETFTSIENLTGSAFRDVLVGNAGANRLEGGDGDDVLWGNDGDDVLVGGAGADKLQGQGGTDTASYAEAASGGGVNLSSGAVWGMAAGDTFLQVENLIGSEFNNTLVGEGGANELSGLGGDDTLYGQAGADTLNGGAGNDSLYGGKDGDTFVFERGDGTDTIQDWQDGSDQLDLSSFGYANFTEVNDDSQQVGSDLLIDFGGADSVRLVGFSKADFDAGDVLI